MKRISRKVVVIRRGNSDDTVKAAVKQLLNGEDLLVDNRNSTTMTTDTLKGVVAAAKVTGAPVIVEQGAIGPLLKVMGFKDYWMFLQREAGRFSFWFINGDQTPPKECLITV